MNTLYYHFDNTYIISYFIKIAIYYLLHYKGNTSAYRYGMQTWLCHLLRKSIIQVDILKVYYYFTTFKSKNIRNCGNICEYFLKIKKPRILVIRRYNGI